MNLVKGFLETSFLDWPGKVAAVVFLPYCNFSCPYCHNHPLVLEPESIPGISLSAVLKRLGQFRSWIDGVVISGGEPTLLQNLPEIISAVKDAGFLVKLDTNGSKPDVLEGLLFQGLLDYVAMDVKAPLDNFRYRKVAGKKVNIKDIRRSCELLMCGETDYEFRTTLCPAVIDEEDCRDLFRQLAGAKRMVLQNFNPHSTMDPALRRYPPLTEEQMRALGEEARQWVDCCRVTG